MMNGGGIRASIGIACPNKPEEALMKAAMRFQRFAAAPTCSRRCADRS